MNHTFQTIDKIPLGLETMSPALLEAQNYHEWNYQWVKPYLSGRLLDIGGGTGNHIRFLESFQLTSIDLSDECIHMLANKYERLPHWNFIQGDITDEKLVEKLGPASFDTVLSCNVFEHIPDDQKAARLSAHLLRKGGKIVLLLPAHENLYGNMDKLAGHFRRYNKKTARILLEQAGFKVEVLRYVNLLGGIGWFVNNRILKHDHLSSPSVNSQIRLFDRYLIPLMRFLEGKRSMPFGQSLVCVGKML